MAPPLVATREEDDSDGGQTTAGSVSSSAESPASKSLSCIASQSPEITDPKTGVSVQLIGKPFGQHGSCIFYKGLTFQRSKSPTHDNKKDNDSTTTTTTSSENSDSVTPTNIGGGGDYFTYLIGEFFFMKYSPQSHLCIGAIQLLWEDKQRKQLLASIKVYFLPEKTPDGRQSTHCQVSQVSFLSFSFFNSLRIYARFLDVFPLLLLLLLLYLFFSLCVKAKKQIGKGRKLYFTIITNDENVC